MAKRELNTKQPKQKPLGLSAESAKTMNGPGGAGVLKRKLIAQADAMAKLPKLRAKRNYPQPTKPTTPIADLEPDHKALLLEAVEAWESLSGGRRVNVKEIELWLRDTMGPMFDKIRIQLKLRIPSKRGMDHYL